MISPLISELEKQPAKKNFPGSKNLTHPKIWGKNLRPLNLKNKKQEQLPSRSFFKGEGPTNQEEKMYDIVNKQGFNKKSFSTCLVYPKQKITFHLFYYLSSYSEK